MDVWSRQAAEEGDKAGVMGSAVGSSFSVDVDMALFWTTAPEVEALAGTQGVLVAAGGSSQEGSVSS